jgi:uncharacterized lipoprotein YbaY
MWYLRSSSLAVFLVYLAGLGLAGLGCCAAVAAQDIRSRDEGSVAGAGVANPRYLPPPVAPQGYRLGVQVRNTDTGVELVSIQSNSVAQRAGLEAGDIIINVAGYQVGYVGDRLYDVGEEIARRVQGNGQVALLVRNRRDGRLLNIPVYFGGTVASRAVTGRLLLKEATAIPPTAVVTVRLMDITQPQWRDVVIGQTQLPAAGGFPRPFRLELPALSAGHRYAVDARVENFGQLLLHSPSPVPLATVDRDQVVDLILTARGLGGTTTPGGLAPRDQIVQWIQSYLGRSPRLLEVEFWLADLNRGKNLKNIQAGILSSTELWERQRRNRDLYIAEVHRLLTGAKPSPGQLNDLRNRYERVRGVRLKFVEELLG